MLTVIEDDGLSRLAVRNVMRNDLPYRAVAMGQDCQAVSYDWTHDPEVKGWVPWSYLMRKEE